MLPQVFAHEKPLTMRIDDLDWTKLRGGYRVPYDPRPALAALESGRDADAAWQELWTELYPQGDVGEASYAAIVELVRIYEAMATPNWNTYALIASIDVARLNPANPGLPEDFRPAYEEAWSQLARRGLAELTDATDPPLVTSILAVLAISKGLRTLGRLAVEFTEDEREELIEAANHL